MSTVSLHNQSVKKLLSRTRRRLFLYSTLILYLLDTMITYRTAHSEDAEAIAALHARSWQQHYRGILHDAYLDQDIEADRRSVWRERLQHPPSNQHIVVATEGDGLGGFACTYAQHDPQWGARLDNLHVTSGWQRRGVGCALMHVSAQWVRQRETEEGLYLWVFEKNAVARTFYDRRGGIKQEETTVENPGGGYAAVLRYVWPDLSPLIYQ